VARSLNQPLVPPVFVPARPRATVPTLTRDARLLFVTRSIRLFGYGVVSIVLVLYLAELGFSAGRIGSLLTLTLVGDTLISLWLSGVADRLGRRRVLAAGALLVFGAGTAFCLSDNYVLLLLAATIGVISPSGNEVGPFLSVEQASLSHLVPAGERTGTFAWYQLVGAFSTAAGALFAGVAVEGMQHAGWTRLEAFRSVLALYAALGLALAVLFLGLTTAVEAGGPRGPRPGPVLLGLHASRRMVFRLSSLFALDAFAGGFIVQSVVVYWFHLRFGMTPAALGAIFFGANLLAGVSALAAGPLARRIGLIETMVVTHIPSNVLLMAVPLMPTAWSAVALLLLRFSISQMDVPTRQSYVMAVVSPEERSAAAGVTGVARTAGAAVSPSLAAMMLAAPALMNLPFLLAGALKIVYDLLVWRGFRAIRPRG
jgi:MFS family permease